MSLNLHQYADTINTVSNKARQELSIEDQIKNIEAKWTVMELIIEVHKGKYFKIISIDPVLKLLEEHKLSL